MIDDHGLGLSHDLPVLLSRRRAIAMAGGAGLGLLLAGCGGGSGSGSSATGEAPATEIPEETAGPFPADGSNGVNALTESGIVRSDITQSFGSASGVATGVPLQVKLRVVDAANGSSPMQGAAVYLWHCDAEGRYSLYDQQISERELSPGRTGGGRRRLDGVRQRLSGRILRPLAAHPLRGVSQPRRRHRRGRQAAHHPARAARGHEPGRVRHGQATRGASTTWRRPRSTAISCSATATHCRWRRSPAPPVGGYRATLTVPV